MKDETRLWLSYAEENLSIASLAMERGDLLDSIYIPSKYPVLGVLPDQFADAQVCHQCMAIAERIIKENRAGL